MQAAPGMASEAAAAPTAAAPPSRGGSERRVREDDTTVHVRGVRFTKLECVGKGGSSKVFKVRLVFPCISFVFPCT